MVIGGATGATEVAAIELSQGDHGCREGWADVDCFILATMTLLVDTWQVEVRLGLRKPFGRRHRGRTYSHSPNPPRHTSSGHIVMTWTMCAECTEHEQASPCPDNMHRFRQRCLFKCSCSPLMGPPLPRRRISQLAAPPSPVALLRPGGGVLALRLARSIDDAAYSAAPGDNASPWCEILRRFHSSPSSAPDPPIRRALRLAACNILRGHPINV